MPLRFGVAGTGFWADDVHLPALATHPDVALHGLWGATRIAPSTSPRPMASAHTAALTNSWMPLTP